VPVKSQKYSISEKHQSPENPGIYLMKNEHDDIIYIGKAKNLKKRLLSYFRAKETLSFKTQKLVEKIKNFEVIITENEVEALILENKWIKKHKPKYNILLKDDKTFPYIKVDYNHDFPRLQLCRKKVLKNKVKYFGPFPNAQAVYQTLRLATKVFKVRDCSDNEMANRSRPCLSYQIKQCTAPCVAKVTAVEYAKQIKDLTTFIKKGPKHYRINWQQKMNKASQETQYELAAEYRDRLKALDSLQAQQEQNVETNKLKDPNLDLWVHKQDEGGAVTFLIYQIRDTIWDGFTTKHLEAECAGLGDHEFEAVFMQYYQKKECPKKIILSNNLYSICDQKLLEKYFEESKIEIINVKKKKTYLALEKISHLNLSRIHEKNVFSDQKTFKALDIIQKKLKLNCFPEHIECLDVSHFAGDNIVASIVCFKKGLPEKASYRKYNIKSIEKGKSDDYASLQELVKRRYVINKDQKKKPDLILVDGGKGQLNAVHDFLRTFDVTIEVRSLAKARNISKGINAKEDDERSDERFFIPGRKNPVLFTRNKEALRILTHLRDEAHRFAIQFQRKKQREKLFK